MSADAEEFDVEAAASDRLGAEPFDPSYDRKYVECPGCVRLVHHSDRSEHAGRCVALKALVIYEGIADDGERARVTAAVGAEPFVRPMGVTGPDAQPARMSGGAS